MACVTFSKATPKPPVVTYWMDWPRRPLWAGREAQTAAGPAEAESHGLKARAAERALTAGVDSRRACR